MGRVGDGLRRIHGALSTPFIGSELRRGVQSIWDPRWVAILLLYVLGVGFMARDPWFGSDIFAWHQGVLAAAAACFVVSAAALEWNLLGRPRGINLLLQGALLFPAALFCGRVLGRSTEPERLASIWGYLKEGAAAVLETAGVTEILPAWLQEIFTSPGLFLFLLFLCAGLSSRRLRTRLGFLTVALGGAALAAIATPPAPSLSFWIGAALTGAGVWLQAVDGRRLRRLEAVYGRLRDVRDRAERAAMIRIVQRALQDGEVSEPVAIAMVRESYAEADLSPDTLAAAARTISYRLVCELGALDIRGTERGFVLTPPEVDPAADDTLAGVAFWPRQILLSAVAILWLLSPIDLIPDAIPITGLLDDAALLVVGSSPLIRHMVEQRRGRSAGPRPPRASAAGE
jgi:hypothetical protein